MTFQFLSQQPGNHAASKKLSNILTANAGRLYLLTGNVSTGAMLTNDLVEILRWGAASPDREIVMLVGVWPKTLCKTVVSEVACLVSGAIRVLLKAGGSFHVNITFWAADRWHVKAIGLTGRGIKFKNATHAIFGSTNFSWSARHGNNYELDLYLDTKTPEGKMFLKDYATAVGDLIRAALGKRTYPNFDGDVHQAVLKLVPSAALFHTTNI